MNQKPFTVLIHSSDRATLRKLCRFLRVFGYQTLTATTVESALAAADAQRPDFVLVDGSHQPADVQIVESIRRHWADDYIYALLLLQRPEIVEVTAALEQGFDDVLAAPVVFGELLARLRAGARVIEFERRLAQQATTDPSTGLAQPGALRRELATRVESGGGWLALLELDHFGRFAATLGRSASLTLLRQVTNHLAAHTAPDCLCAWLGQDRIAVVIPQQTSDAAWNRCQQALHSLAAATFTHAELPYQMTASAGLVEIVAGATVEALLEQAGRAVALAKTSGGNCAVSCSQVERDTEDWNAFAAGGRLFETTVARDVMQPCPVLIHPDETLDQAHAILSWTGLPQAPVVDEEGRLVGLVGLDELAALQLRQHQPRAPGANNHHSVRLVKQAMHTGVMRFEESTPLAELIEYFAGESESVAVVVRDKAPRGLIHCQALAMLNEHLHQGQFINLHPSSGGSSSGSSDLAVPELALAE